MRRRDDKKFSISQPSELTKKGDFAPFSLAIDTGKTQQRPGGSGPDDLKLTIGHKLIRILY